MNVNKFVEVSLPACSANNLVEIRSVEQQGFCMQLCFKGSSVNFVSSEKKKKETYQQKVHQHVSQVDTVKGVAVLIHRVQEMHQQVIMAILVLLIFITFRDRIRMTLDLLRNCCVDNRHQDLVHILDLLWELPGR